jgi:hypothetical protein
VLADQHQQLYRRFLCGSRARNFIKSILRIAAGTIAGFPRESLKLGQWHRECAMRGKQIKFQSDSVMADVYLGVTVAGLYTLVGMGLIIVFM